MSAYGRIYANWRKNLGSKVESFSADTFKVALYSNTYTPAVDTDCAYSVPTPAAPTVSQGGSGGPAGQTVFYRIAHVNPAGTSPAGANQSSVTASGQVTTITSPANPGGSCTGYNVYASVTSGSEVLQTTGQNVPYGTNWTEPNSGITGGALFPSANTAAISGELPTTGGSYTAGGVALTGASWSKVMANSWADVWASGTAYALGQIVRPATGNLYVYKCVQAGTSGGSAPTWGTTLDGLTTDGTVQWLCLNTSLITLTAANVSWSVSTIITYYYAVIYDSSTNDLVALINPGVAQTGPSSGSININWDSAGIVWM